MIQRKWETNEFQKLLLEDEDACNVFLNNLSIQELIYLSNCSDIVQEKVKKHIIHHRNFDPDSEENLINYLLNYGCYR